MGYLMDRASQIVDMANEMDYIPHRIVVDSSPSLSKIVVNGQELINFCTNNYLDLTNDQRVVEAKIEATRKYGVGAGAARWMAGNHRLHVELEEKIAEFKGCEAATIFSSGTLANNGAIKAILSPALLPILTKNKSFKGSNSCKTKIIVMFFAYNHQISFDKRTQSRD